MTTDEIRSRLFAMQDVKYRDFQGGLIPGMNPENMIGVRTPELRKLAKEVGADDTFLAELPHRYFDENQLHAFIVSGTGTSRSACAGRRNSCPMLTTGRPATRCR